MRKIFRKSLSLLNGCQFILENLWATRKLPLIKTVKVGELTIGFPRKNELQEVMNIYQELRSSQSISLANDVIWRLLRRKLVFVAKDLKNNILGIGLTYFNKRDIEERTLHLAFLGVKVSASNRGIGSMIEQTEVNHFKNTNLLGLSARISLSNIGALRISERNGFVPITKYYDTTMGEERYYLIKMFEK